jgi:hypothetical protein
MIVLLAMACITVPAVGISGYSMTGSSVDTLGGGISENESRACSFLITNSTNYDSVIVGNDKAVSFGNYWDHGIFGPQAIAQNNLKIEKNQMAGNRICCFSALNSTAPCEQCNPLINLEKIRVGNRAAFAYGNAAGVNNMKIVTNQE